LAWDINDITSNVTYIYNYIYIHKYIIYIYTHMLYLHTKHCSSGHLRHAGDILLAGRCRQDGACEGLVKPGNDPLYGVKSKPNPL
jgi:hypothetical protein